MIELLVSLITVTVKPCRARAAMRDSGFVYRWRRPLSWCGIQIRFRGLIHLPPFLSSWTQPAPPPQCDIGKSPTSVIGIIRLVISRGS